MKRFFNLLSALALVVSMQGCGSGPSVEPEIPDNLTQSAVQLRLKGHIASIAPSTRVNADGFVANDKVGVYVSATGALSSSGNMLNNEAFTYSSGNLAAPAGEEVYWGAEDTRLSVWAYYPYVENVSNNAAYPFVVHANQVGANNFYNSDFITAQATNLASQTTPVNLTFNHSLSRINVTLTAGEGITNDELAAAEKNMYIKGMIVDGTIDLSNGMASVGSTKADIMPFAADSRTYSAIVYPQQGSVTFRLEMDDDVFTYTTDVDYAAAKQYDYTLTVNVSEPQHMTLSATTINPWSDGEDFSGTMSDIINIPDPIFKEYLLCEVVYEECEYDADSYVYKEGDITLGSSYTNTYYRPTVQKIDANNDGEISTTEAKQVNVINATKYNNIADLTGIEYFVNLEILLCEKSFSLSYNPDDGSFTKSYPSIVLSSLDVTKNTKLKILGCDGNALNSLDVSHNPMLSVLNCRANELRNLDLSNNSSLIYLNCNYNNITALSVSHLTNLIVLQCGNNEITLLDVSMNTALENLNCSSNRLTTLDVSKNTALTYLCCEASQLTALDVSQNTALTILICGANQLTTLDVSRNTTLGYLDCSGNQLTLLDVSKNTALTWLSCDNNQLTSLDVSNNIALEEFNLSHNQLTLLDVSKNTKLWHLYCERNQLTSLDISNNLALTILDCNPMEDEDGNNLLATLYLATGQEIATLDKPEATVIEYK